MQEVTAASEAFARLYDLDLSDDPGDLDLYLALAGRMGGPILELGAGTGRLAVPLATAGHQVTAVDIDPAASPSPTSGCPTRTISPGSTAG